MPIPRLLIDDARLAEGAELALNEGQARHVGVVLRLAPGEALVVFNAEDGEWSARIIGKSKRGMALRVEAFRRPALTVRDLDLLFAPVKRHATDLIIEKATELGVARIRPIITQRTIAETARLERWSAIAREAAEQTGRFDTPAMFAPLALAKTLDGWDGGRALIYCDEAGDAPPIVEVLASRREKKLALLIGPEGGFTPEERAMLRARDFVVPVSLGPRILRAETAVIAALSIIQAVWGDWRGM